MAGDSDEAHMCVLLLVITVFMRLVFIRRRNRFQQRLRLLTIRGRRRRTEANFLHSQRICRRRKVAWVLERPQFWFEHMLLNQYANNIWREHFRISRQTFQFICNLVRPHLPTRHKHATSDSSGEASSCCFVAACNRKFV